MLKQCLGYVREGDQLIVTRIDRLARSTLHLCQIAETLRKKGVDLVVLDQNIDTSDATGRLLFNMLGAIGQFETQIRAERQMDGIKKAKDRGVQFGKRPALSEDQISELCEKTRTRHPHQGSHGPLRPLKGHHLSISRNERHLKATSDHKFRLAPYFALSPTRPHGAGHDSTSISDLFVASNCLPVTLSTNSMLSNHLSILDFGAWPLGMIQAIPVRLSDRITTFQKADGVEIPWLSKKKSSSKLLPHIGPVILTYRATKADKLGLVLSGCRAGGIVAG